MSNKCIFNDLFPCRSSFFFSASPNGSPALLPHMVQRKQGKIVCISSVAGIVPIPFRSAYAASQHALQAFCDSLRAEVAAYNIQVLVCSPGYKATDIVTPTPPATTVNEEREYWNIWMDVGCFENGMWFECEICIRGLKREEKERH